MKKNLALRLPLFLVALLGIALPYFASANTLPVATDIWNPTTLASPILICSGTGNSAYTIDNGSGSTVNVPALPPCQNLCDLVNEFENVLYIMIAYAIWVIAPVAFIAGGIMYMLAGVNQKLEGAAKETLKGAVIGVIIVLCSYIIIASFIGIFTNTPLGSYIGGFGASCSISNSQ